MAGTFTSNTGAARQGTISIAGSTFAIFQDAPVALQSITVSPNPGSAAAGSILQFTATGQYSDGSTQVLTASVIWSSPNTAIATIRNAAATQGLVTAVSAGGPVTIAAALNGIGGTAQLTVKAPVLPSLAPLGVSPASGSGNSQTFTFQFSDSNGYRSAPAATIWD